jgi:hypothetical protein
MFAISNKYALTEEVTLDTREQKKEKDPGHTDQPSSSKGNDKKRKAIHSVNAVEQMWCNKEYWPRPGEFEGFLDGICIFHPKGKHKTQLWPTPRFHRWSAQVGQRANQEKKLKEPKGDFPEAHKEVNYIYGGPDSFNCSNHPDIVPKPGQYPLIVRPIVKDVKLNRVLVDGGSSLNNLFLKIFN